MLDTIHDPVVSCVAGAFPEVGVRAQAAQDRSLSNGKLLDIIAAAATAGSIPLSCNLPMQQEIQYSREPKSQGRRNLGGGTSPLVVVHVVEGCRGGVGTAVKHLIQEQERDSSIGEIHLLADPDRLGEMLINVPAQSHWYKSSRAVHKIVQVSKSIHEMLQEIQPDVVYLHSTFSGLYGRLGFGGMKTRWATVYCPHGWSFSQSVALPKRLVYATAERLLSRRADAIVSVSRHEEQEAIRNGIHHARHRVIRHGVPASEKGPLPALVHDESQVNLLFIGRFDRQKGLDLLLEAWRDPRLGNVHLWLIGDATLGGKIEIPRLSNVHLLGWIKHEDIDSYIQCFDAVIVPSRWEAFGLVAVEAMRNGRAVIASRIGGLQELVIDNVNGLLFEPGDREGLINEVSRLEKKQLAKMGEMARDVFHAGFEWPACYAQWKRLTEDVVIQRRLQTGTSLVTEKMHLVGQLLKRTIDVSLSCAAMIALFPALLSIAVAIKLGSRGPILFGHNRCGRDGETFRVWKFRTMVLDADQVLQNYLRENPEAMQEWQRDFKLRKDPRVTAIGRFLRRYSLDEVPQLINVLVGNMSIVGPRPIVQMEVERYAEAYDLYTRVKPGITGLWQVSGRSDTTYAQRIAFDIFYVRNWSIWLDLSIIWRTFYVVLAARGSY